MRYIDFHTHILPEIDDGAANAELSVAMLKKARECGAETVLLTPHYYGNESIDAFIEKRNEKFLLLKKEMEKDGGSFPKLLLGAEVFLNRAYSEDESLQKLCIEGTSLLLLELPYNVRSKWHYEEIFRIQANRNISPVLAHIERYLQKPKDIESIEKLVSTGAYFQVNFDSFRTFSGRRRIRPLAAKGLICALGSDCHNDTTRSADVSKAIKMFEKKFGNQFFDYLYNKTDTLLKKHTV